MRVKKPSKDTPRVMANPAKPHGLHHALAHGFSEAAKASRNLERLLHQIAGSFLENSPHTAAHRVNGIARGNFAIQKKPWTSGEREPAPFACRFGRDVPFRSRRLNHSDLRIADVVSVIFLVHHVGFRHVEARISTSASLPTIQFRACGNHGQAVHIAARHVNDWIHAVIEM